MRPKKQHKIKGRRRITILEHDKYLDRVRVETESKKDYYEGLGYSVVKEYNKGKE